MLTLQSRVYIKLPRKVVRDLKKISYLSSKKKWEFAGSINFVFENNEYKFNSPTLFTSKHKNRVSIETVERAWPSLIAYHTHPSILQPNIDDFDSTQIFTTLPSNADFEAFIKGYPEMQSNIICDAHGYYVIDVIKSMEKNALPLPDSVAKEMKEFRKRPFLLDRVFSEDGLEYHQSNLIEWKYFINYELNFRLIRLFGICIRYYGYNEDPATIVINYHKNDS